jgi:hypothetical protein
MIDDPRVVPIAKAILVLSFFGIDQTHAKEFLNQANTARSKLLA